MWEYVCNILVYTWDCEWGFILFIYLLCLVWLLDIPFLRVLFKAHILTMRYRWNKKSTLFTDWSFTTYSYFRNKHNGSTQESSSARNETEWNHFKVNEFLETKRTGQEPASSLYSDVGSEKHVQHVESGVARRTDALCTCWSLGRIFLFPQANVRVIC